MYWEAIIGGVWGLVLITLFIKALRLSYRIEGKADRPAKLGVPRQTNVFRSAFGRSGDAETLELRRRLRGHIAIIAGLMVIGWMVLSSFSPAPH